MQVATEDIPDTRLRAALDSGRYTATSAIDEVERFDVALISVPTPLKEGIPDLFDVGWATLRSAATKETKSDPAQPGADLEADPSDLVVDVEPASVGRPGRSRH